MASKTARKIAISLFLFLSIFVCAILYARWYVTSGRLRALVEKRAGEAINANVRIESLRPAWPPRIEIENLVVSAPGYEDAPLLTCPKITIKGAAWELVRGHVGSIVVDSPRVGISRDEGRGSNIPAFPTGDREGGAPSFGAIKIVDARIDVDLPEANVSLRGIRVDLSARQTPSGVEEIVKLDVDAIDISITRAGEDPIPIGLKMIQSKFVRRDKPQGDEIEGEINAGLSATAPYLRLPPNIPIRLLFEFDHFPERDSLENGIFTLELTPSLGVSAYGSIAGLTSDDPSPELKITVSPVEAGALAEYVEPLRRPIFEEMKVSGNIRIGGTLSGPLSDPEVTVRVKTEQGRVEWKGLVLEGLEIEVPLALRDGAARIEACRLSAARVVAPFGEETFEVAALSGIVSGDAERIKMEEATARLGNVGEVAFRVAYEPGSGLVSANIRMADASVAEALEYASPVIGALPDGVSMSGRLNLELDVEAKAGSGLGALGVKYRVSLSKGEMTSGELVAAAGIDATLEGSVETKAPEGPWEFDASGHAGGFELLVDTFYKDFSGDRFPFSFSGEYAPEGSGRLRAAEVSLGLGPTGGISASGEIHLGAPAEGAYAGAAVKLKTERIDLGELYEWMGGALLAEVAPDLDVGSVGGVVSGDVDIGFNGEQWTVEGRLKLDDGRIELDGGALAMESLSIDLPFGVYFPQEGQAESRGPVDFAPADYGSVKVGALGVGPVIVSSLDLEVALKENALRVRGPTTVEVFGGSVEIGAIKGENLFGAEAAASTSLFARDISLEEITEALGLPEVVGAIGADFPEIILTSETLMVEGAAGVEAFGGTVEVTSLEVAKPLSSVRTLMADVRVSEIDLSALTQALGFGSISGVMEGTLSGFEMSQGQPAAFVADFQTVKRRGVRQRINIDAVENITILGTGQGFQMSLGRGFASFFDEFRYDSIGFYCTLKNDKFKVNGKTVRGDTEYFVKGVTLGPQINVINRSPGQTTSFKSMLERVNRIGSKDAEDQWNQKTESESGANTTEVVK